MEECFNLTEGLRTIRVQTYRVQKATGGPNPGQQTSGKWSVSEHFEPPASTRVDVDGGGATSPELSYPLVFVAVVCELVPLSFESSSSRRDEKAKLGGLCDAQRLDVPLAEGALVLR